MRFAAVALLVAAAALGCAGQWGSAAGPTSLMTRGELAGRREPASLVAYLGQPDADPAACEAPPGVDMPVVARELSAALVEGLAARRIAPDIWGQCMGRLLRDTGRESAAALVEEVTDAYLRLLDEQHWLLERDRFLQRRLTAMHDLYLARPPTARLVLAYARRLERDLEKLLARRKLGPFGVAHVNELLELLALERGWRFELLTVAPRCSTRPRPCIKRPASTTQEVAWRSSAPRSHSLWPRRTGPSP